MLKSCLPRLLLAAATVCLPSVAAAQQQAPSYRMVPRVQRTGWVQNNTSTSQVVISFEVYQPGAEWLRLYFESVDLGGDLPSRTNGLLRITSHLDGNVQEMRATHLRQWQNSSAYFNGDTVQVEVIAHPGQGAQVTLSSVDAGYSEIDESICGSTDNRISSNDARVARFLPIGLHQLVDRRLQRLLLDRGPLRNVERLPG